MGLTNWIKAASYVSALRSNVSLSREIAMIAEEKDFNDGCKTITISNNEIRECFKTFIEKV